MTNLENRHCAPLDLLRRSGGGGMTPVVWLWVVLGLWFAAAVYGGMAGLFAAGPDQLARPVILTILVPTALFLMFYAGSAGFRGLILDRDIRFLTMLQSWRVVGFVFLPLYFYGVLPGLFAWPAGVGDVAMGLSAPLMVYWLVRRPGFAEGRGFLVWNLLGITDFFIAGITSTLASGAVPALVAGPVTATPMEIWPMFMFPAFVVPLFMMMHLSVIFKTLAQRRADGAQESPAIQLNRERGEPI